MSGLSFPTLGRHDRHAARDVLRVTPPGMTVPAVDGGRLFALDPRTCDRRATRPVAGVAGVGRPFPARARLTYETPEIIGAGHPHRSWPS